MMKPQIEPFKRGRRTCGYLYKLDDGRKAFLAVRKLADIARHGEKTISDAIRKGVATWSIDDESLIKIRATGVQFAGILVKDSGDIYLTLTELFYGEHSRIGGGTFYSAGPSRHLPVQLFRRKSGRVRKL